MFGERFSAEVALQNGMINRIIKDQSILEFVAERAAQLAALPNPSILATKQLLKANHGQVMETINHEIVSFSRLLHGKECQQIIASMVR